MTTSTLDRPRSAIGQLDARYAAALAGPLLFLLGQALLPVLPDSLDQAFPQMVEHRDRLMAARLCTSAGGFLLVAAAVQYVRVVPVGRGAALLRIGAVLFGVGSFCNALSQAVAGYATWTVTSRGFDDAAAQYVIDHVEAGTVAIPLGFWSIPAFAVGALLMAVALWRSQRVPAWLPLLLIVGVVLAAALAGRGPVVALTQAPFTAAMLVLARLSVTADAARPSESH